jgi:hypothetical protein
MAKKKKDFGLILSLALIIVIASYWFVKEVPMEGVEHYVDLLGDKLMAMIPKDKDKEEVAAIYDEFRNKVKEKKVEPEQVEKVASAIINLSNRSDSLTLSEAEALIQIAIMDVPMDTFGLVHIPDVEASPEEWEELNKRLSSVYHVEEKLKAKNLTIPKPHKPAYRVDEKLNIIMDNRVKPELEKEKLLETLESQEQIFWSDSVAESMEKDMEKLEIELRALTIELADFEIQRNLLKLKVLSHPVGENIIIALDSLDVVTMIKWDSIESEVTKEIREIDSKHKREIVVEPSEERN